MLMTAHFFGKKNPRLLMDPADFGCTLIWVMT